MQKQKRILLADYEGWESLMEIPRLFTSAGAEVDLYCRERSWLPIGRRHRLHIQASEDKEEYLARLLSLAGSYDWVVLGDDMTARLVADVSDEGLFKKLAPLVKPENREILGSKAGLSLACKRYGISTPAFEIYDGSMPILELAERVSFPVLLKIDESAGGTGLRLCKNAAELERVFAVFSEREKKDLLIQRYVQGDNIAVEALFKDGQLLMHAQSMVVKTVSGEFGVSSERRYMYRSEIETFIARAGAALGLGGFASMTLMRDAAGLYLVEADLRPQAWCPLAAIAGVRFEEGIRAWLADSPPPMLVRPASEIIIRHFPRDLLWCARNQDYLGIFKWCYGAEGRWRALPWRAPGVFFGILVRGGRYIVRHSWRRTLRCFGTAIAFVSITHVR